MLVTSAWWIDVPLLIAIVILSLHLYLSRNYNYWKKKGIVYLKPRPFVGNFFGVLCFKTTIAHWLQDIYKSTDEPYVGVYVFDRPLLVVNSPEIIKDILIKDFNHFTDRTILAPEHNQMIANVLFFQQHDSWKVMRAKIRTAFTLGKLKKMFPILKDIGSELNIYLRNNKGILDCKDLSSRYATEVIARTAFAVDGHCFEQDECDFNKIGRLLFDFRWRNTINQLVYFFLPHLAKLLRLEFIDRWINDYFREVFWKTMKYREETDLKVNDLFEIVVELRKNKEFCSQMKFEGDKAVATVVQFFGAGIETTSGAVSFTLYELCLNPQIQNKLRAEIFEHVKDSQGITYDALKDMKYLEMCILETLRKYPVGSFLDRRCNTDWTIPGTNITIDKGTPIYFPVLGLHLDEKFFPDPLKYDPERFAVKNRYNQGGLYFLPFGDGPRKCLGEQFGMMTVKSGLVHILSQFVVEPVKSTPVPVQFSTRSFILQSTVGLPMKFVEYNSTNNKMKSFTNNNF